MNHMKTNDDKSVVISVPNIKSSYVAHDDNKISEHIYENISVRRNRSISDLLIKYMRKFKPKMIENDKNLSLMSAKTFQSYCEILYNENEENEQNFTYLPCHEENMYENVNFNFQICWEDDENVMKNESLFNWLEMLSSDTEAYESTDMMMTKCIPSRNKNVTCSYNMNNQADFVTHSANDFALDQYKLSIIYKCFSAIWQQDSENEILNSLYGFLNEIFAAYFKKSSSYGPMKAVENEIKNKKNVQLSKMCENSSSNYMPAYKSVDKKINRKLETFILSVTLNRLTITYSESLKFFFALEHSQAFQYFDVKPSKLIKSYWNSPNTNREFILTLKLIFSNRSRQNNSIKYQPTAVEENIYQPIWKWQTDCNGMIRNDDDSVKILSDTDDQDWEIDSEFSFVDVKVQKSQMYNPITILYSIENPELNRIIYSLKSTQLSKEDNTNKTFHLPVNDGEAQLGIALPIHDVEYNSVSEWKNLLKQPFYLEDEEDVILSSHYLESIQNEHIKPLPMNNVHKEEAPRKNMTSISNGSYELKSATSDSAIGFSVEGSYRNIDEVPKKVDSSSVETVSEPIKKGGFRDKVKGAFYFRSNKNNSNQELNLQKEIEEDYFGSNIDLVEKINSVSKIVKDCVTVLESNANIKTPGLYRVSGNKTVIEALKKKLNDKKMLKKEELLQNQDVHCITGLLKMFFRELTPSIMTSKTFTLCTSEKVTSEQINSYLKEMPDCNYRTLKFLIHHLKRVEIDKDENLMSSANLAICWGLCLFSSCFDASNQFFENDISKCNMLCKKMIDNFDVIFK